MAKKGMARTPDPLTATQALIAAVRDLIDNGIVVECPELEALLNKAEADARAFVALPQKEKALEDVRAVLASIVEWCGNPTPLMNVDVFEWREQLEAALALVETTPEEYNPVVVAPERTDP